MEEPSPEETGPDLKCEDLNAVAEADVDNNDNLTKPDGESCGVDVEADNTEQAAAEAEEVTVQNAPEKAEEEMEASGRDEAPVSLDSEERAASDGENQAEELEGQAEEDSRQSEVTETDTVTTRALSEEDLRQGEEEVTEIVEAEDDLQPDLQLDSEENQELLRELQTEHEDLSELNYQLQAKLAEYFRLKSGEELQANQECCQKYPDIIEDLKRQWEDRKQKQLQQRHVDDLLRQSNKNLEQMELEWNMLISSQREVLIADLEQMKGKTEAQAVVERLLSAAQKCEDEFGSVRQENLKLKRKMHQLETELHVREENLNGEMSYLDFEQLNIENQTFGEKIQECKEDLLKLKRMLPHTGQILMHVKEKLRFVQVENQKKQACFDELDALVLHEQQTLTQTMQTRDKLRFDNLRMRQNSGLLGRPALLRDLEDTEDKREALESQVEMLKRS